LPAIGILAALLVIFLAGPASAERRFALVVGNDAYAEVTPLKKAASDARAVATTLEPLGFEVTVIENASRVALSRELVAFENRIGPGDTVLFFFAGHGFEIRGDNYLLPTDVPEAREGEESLVRDASFAAKDVIDRLQARGAGTVIAVLDACRNNPFARPGTRALGGATRGLSRMDPQEGVFILFSAGAKQEALDALGSGDPDPNSVFTRTFVESLTVPGLSLVQIAKETQARVKALAAAIGHDQTPAYYDQIVGDYYLRPPVDGEQPVVGAADNAIAAEVAAWKAISGSSEEADFRSYLTRYGETALFAEEARRQLASLQTAREEPAPRPRAAAEECASFGETTYCVSSVLPSQSGNAYGVRNLFDGAGSTAWLPTKQSRGIGQWVTIEFPDRRAVSSILVDNGYQKNDDIFAKNSRVSTIRAVFSDGTEQDFRLDDAAGTQRLTLDSPATAAWVQIIITGTYPGWKYPDETAMSRLVVE
jgi:hypothetical protein